MTSISWDASNFTASPAPVSGASPPASPAGPTTDLFGPLPFPASPSAPPASNAASPTIGICGPISFASSERADPSDWLANKLQARLVLGSTERALTWKRSVTSSGSSLWQLAPSMRRTSGNGSSGPRSEWPTPTVADIEGGRKTRSGARSDEMLLNGLMGQWRSPTAGEKRGGAYSDPAKSQARMESGHAINLEDQITTWATPRAEAARALGDPKHMGGRRGAGNIEDQMQTWATPAARDWRSDRSQMTSDDLYGTKGRPLARQITEASGWTPNGSPAPTEKRGAPNPEFACWLMGWSADLTFGVLQAIQLFRSSPRKSSKRSKSGLTNDLFG